MEVVASRRRRRRQPRRNAGEAAGSSSATSSGVVGKALASFGPRSARLRLRSKISSGEGGHVARGILPRAVVGMIGERMGALTPAPAAYRICARSAVRHAPHAAGEAASSLCHIGSDARGRRAEAEMLA